MTLKRQAISAEIPSSSMADVAFLLIVFFMVTATFAVTRGLDFTFPREVEAPQVVDPLASVLVEVRAHGALVVDGRPTALADLLEALRPKLEREPGKPVIVRTDPAAPYGAAVAVLDELRQGRKRLGLEEEIAIALPTEREAAQLGF